MKPWFSVRGRDCLMTSALLAALVGVSCSSEGPPRPGADDPSGGAGGESSTGGSGGSKASGGSPGSGGSGGVKGTGGSGSGGSMGSGGSAGSGGSGGAGGSGGKPDAGAGGSPGGDAGSAAPTFTEVYTQIMSEMPAVPSSSCWGPCHAGPGTAKAMAKIDMTTKEKAWPGVMKLVVPRNAAASKLYVELNTGKMPEKKPKLPANLIQLVAAWINAGAMNN